MPIRVVQLGSPRAADEGLRLVRRGRALRFSVSPLITELQSHKSLIV